MDKVRRWFVETAAAWAPLVREAYIPAQHTSKSTSWAARVQHRAHKLAAVVRGNAEPWTVPVPDLLGDLWHLVKSGSICLSLSATLDAAYAGANVVGGHLDIVAGVDARTGAVWESVVENGQLSNVQLRLLAWLRAARWLHEGDSDFMTCLFCSSAVSGWGVHLLSVCPKLAQGVLLAFRAVAFALEAQGWSLQWVNATSFLAVPKRGQPRSVKLIRDHELQYQAGQHQSFMLWSGLWVDKISGEESPRVHRGVMLRYAAALEEAMKEGNWPLFRSGPLEVPGSYTL